MFTGIITDQGRIDRIGRTAKGADIQIACAYPADTIGIGASIACNGVCLTVTKTGTSDDKSWFECDVSNETLECTTLGQWREGDLVNLERALKIGDELGGHLVLGHVDGVAEITGRRDDGASKRFEVGVPERLARFIAAKGSVALDGVSLTVNSVLGAQFSINIVPHTAEVTTFGRLGVGDSINIEIDQLARYAARLNEFEPQDKPEHV